MILDVIICTSFEMLGYFGPPITVLDVEVENFLVFFIRPFVLLNIRIQMVMPAFSALLSNSARQELSDFAPVLGTVFLDTINQHTVFRVKPRPFNHLWIEYLLPTM